ncbi:MAG: hypothetical protein J5685_12390 [Clostridiales bacterium]|nr:hypothetical protein [Clostridiales bacterium]
MKNNTSVRRPALAGNGKRDDDISVGDVLRKAKKELLIKRIVYGVLLFLFAAAVFVIFRLGLVDRFVDVLYSMLG